MGNPLILVVDDEPLNVKLLRAILSDNGYNVLAGGTGREALALAGQNPDVILLDLMMPEIDGFETCRRLKEDPVTRDIPVIFLTALSDAKYKLFGSRLGGADYITKPFDQGELLARVRTQLTIRAQEKKLQDYTERLREREEVQNGPSGLDDQGGDPEAPKNALFQEIRYHLGDLLDGVALIDQDLAGLKALLGKVADPRAGNPLAEQIRKLTAHLEKISRGRENLEGLLRDLPARSDREVARS